jgi:hypothetical protein
MTSNVIGQVKIKLHEGRQGLYDVIGLVYLISLTDSAN